MALMDVLKDHPKDPGDFRGLVEHSAQGVLIQSAGKPVYANVALARMLGYTHPREVLQLASIFELVDPREHSRIERIVARRRAGLEAPDVYVFRARRRDGTLIWLENRVNGVTWAGQAAQQCTLVDVSDRQRANNALRLAARVAARAGEKDNFEEAIEVALRWLARGMGWELAESWLPSASGDVLRSGPVWCRDRVRFKRFLAKTCEHEFRPGEGLPGRVWAKGRPEWIADVRVVEAGFRRSIIANDAGIKSGCGIPIVTRGRIVAVLCFFSVSAQADQTALAVALSGGASALGPVLAHIQSERARRGGLEQMELLITWNPDGILVVDDKDRVLFANPAAERAFGRSRKTLIGMSFGTPSMDAGSAEIESRNVRDGRTRLNEMRVVEIEWQGRPARLVSLRDVTDRHDAQLASEYHRKALQERVKELQCLYAVSDCLARNDMAWECILKQVVEAIPAGMQYPATTCARLKVQDIEVTTSLFKETAWHITREICIDEEVLGSVDVFCTERVLDEDGSPFVAEEYQLLEELSRRIAHSVSARRDQYALELTRQRFQDFAEAASDWLWEMDENFRFTYFSDRIEAVLGQPAQQWIGQTRVAVTAENPDDPKWTRHCADLEARRPFRRFRYEIALPDGSTKHVSISGVPVHDLNGVFKGYRGTGTDETREVEARHLASESDRRLRNVADRLPGIVSQRLRKADGTLQYPYLSAGTLDALGYPANELQAESCLLLDCIHADDRPRFDMALTESARTLRPMDVTYRLYTRDGEVRWYWHRSAPRRLESSDILWDCLDLDVTEHKRAEARIQYLGYHDQLTGLPNRELFVERFNQILPIASRNESQVAVAMLGLKRFKQVNEELGVDAGDEILRTVAQRFPECLRPGDTVARFGGDRFLLLLPSVGRDPATHKPFERLMAAMERPFSVKHRQIVLRFNMGIALFPDDGDGPEALIQKADTAQAHFNRWGPGFGYTFYQARMPASESSRLALEKDLRDAIEGGQQLEAYFQPIVEAASGRILAVETLARWHHPQRGLVAPSEFIPLAEDTGLIAPLGLRILRQACERAREWFEAGRRPLMLSVNLSARQFRDPELSRSVRHILEETGMPPRRLALEVTETSLIADLDYATQFMKELGAFGVQFALDDFGVGYSSLSYLGRLPVQVLKIDRSFVQDLKPRSRGETAIKAVVGLAHALELHVVAEGIETSDQLEHVKQLGCDTVQGFYLAKPMPANELEALLARTEGVENGSPLYKSRH